MILPKTLILHIKGNSGLFARSAGRTLRFATMDMQWTHIRWTMQ
uniref:Uncharacterized protein n=2 Tax=unclassified Caudoviricetes TaxID=2788787 RepID=A0A8S5NG09_9CAUD|nr:MAG TPA: hypothetical protein [Siphoviridae sp. ct0UA44]DAD99603.1 MAG TPA: hypothetical protein [Siphoviridae sp. ctind17]DAU19927.1 MAG TPA: hypothetical protein [Caudoviricetes sp.]